MSPTRRKAKPSTTAPAEVAPPLESTESASVEVAPAEVEPAAVTPEVAPDDPAPAEVGSDVTAVEVSRPTAAIAKIRWSGLRRLGFVPARIPRPGAQFEKFAWLPAGLAVAAAVVLVSVFSATVQSTDATLVTMGFDPDRAQLITALLVGAVAAAVANLLVNRVAYATVLGTGALVALFAETFGAETQTAAASSGATGVFDLGGWTLTLVTLFAIGAISAWAGSTLAAAVRPGMIATGQAVREVAKTRRPSIELARRPVAAVLIFVLLAVTVPAFGDMVNLSPDALMLNGGQHQGLVPGNSFPDVSPIAQVSPTPTPVPSPSSSDSPSAGRSTEPSPPPSPRITAAPGTKPWLAWKPSGAGNILAVNLPAPWIGGTKSTSEIDIYTPPGYNATGDRLYPVVYEAPTGFTLWNKGTSVQGALDSLINSGEMPAAIVVFIDSLGPPYVDTQCADAVDKQQWFETYISQTVVQYVDDRYHTIKDPAARAIMGMSAGGFCAPMLALRHPDVFSVSISISGYFWAGAAGPNSLVPFGGAGVGREVHSPAWLAPRFDGDKSKLYFIVISNLNQEFYGPAATQFEGILKDAGFAYLAVDSLYTHGWPQVRYETPGALKAWGARLVVNGVW